mmetsp:Transcript_7369/g.20434  ORF Transcript_7369/g.20434 Transcript_7369/m.20434 type:complete len:257 (-) Transcript_7369:945-1715(-)
MFLQLKKGWVGLIAKMALWSPLCTHIRTSGKFLEGTRAHFSINCFLSRRITIKVVLNNLIQKIAAGNNGSELDTEVVRPRKFSMQCINLGRGRGQSMLQEGRTVSGETVAYPRFAKIIWFIGGKWLTNSKATHLVRFQHNVIFFSCQKTHLVRSIDECLGILVGRALDDLQVAVNKFFAEFTCCTEINKMCCSRTYIIEEVTPIRIGLHETPHKQLLHCKSKDRPSNTIAFLLIEIRYLVDCTTLGKLRREHTSGT